MVDTLMRTHTIPDSSKIWWDVRPNSSYPTLEVRICDVCTRVDEAVCVAAIFQAIIAKLWQLRAATDLARLWRDQGRRGEAHALLSPLYNWFTEGLDTPALKDAKALLEMVGPVA